MEDGLRGTLKRLRKLKGYTQDSLAIELGISTNYLSQIETGRKSMSMSLLTQYSQVFGIEISQLMYLVEMLENNTPKIEPKKSTLEIYTVLTSLQESGVR